MKKMIKKKEQSSKKYRLMGIVTFASIILIIWEMFIFRKTFINIFIPLSLFFIGGPILFFIFRKKIKYYIETENGLLKQVFHGTILFGGTFMFTFMSLNYYLPYGKTKQYDLKVIETGNLTRKRGCDPPFAIVDYYGFEKKLVFPCNVELGNTKRINVKLQKGLFGFMVVNDSKFVNSKLSKSYSNKDSELEK